MKRETFSISIEAPKEKVWDILWNSDTYPLWTSPFCEGSMVETDWQQGSKVKFLSPSGAGILSTIAENRSFEFMSFRHIGEIKDGIEDTESEAVKEWAGAMENYAILVKQNKTVLTVETDINEKYSDYFVPTWLKALEEVKKLAEKQNVSEPV